MTIKPVQADFMNYTYFFKGNYRKGLHRMTAMLTDPTQFQLFLDNPIALSAAFSSDKVQTPALCELVYNLGETKRVQVANAYAGVFGYADYEELLTSDEAPLWQKNSVFLMTCSELTLDNFKLALSAKIPVSSWVGKDLNLGYIKNDTGVNCDGTVTIVDVLHDDKSDGSGKALYTVCIKDGELLKNGTDTNLLKINNSSTNEGGWKSSAMRTNLSKFSLSDSTLNSHVVPVNKITNNYGRNTNLSSVSTTSDKFWIPSSYEMFGSKAANSSYPYYILEGTPYLHLVSSNNIRNNGNGSPQYYWVRTPTGGSSDAFRIVTDSGALSNHNASNSNGVPLGFAID